MKIAIASPVDPVALERLSREHAVAFAPNPTAAELRDLVRDAEILVFRSGVTISREILRAAPGLRLVIRAGSGLDNLDLAEVERRGIRLARIPRPSAQAVAELAFGLMLALARNVLPLDSLLRQGRWAKNTYESVLVGGKTLGIVGAGNIGGRLGQLAACFGMRVLGCVADPENGARERLGALGIELAAFDEVVAQAEFLSVHVPLTDETRGLVGAEVLAKMKHGSYLVNTARGGVVDEDALYHALRSGERLRGAALDVHEKEGPGSLSPLRFLPNVILTPHVGATTVDTQREIGAEIVRIVEAFAAGPECEAPASRTAP
jgi:phosphoglycerate dehydrogenase-like enzyme